MNNILVADSLRLQQRFIWPDWFHDAVTANQIITHGLGKFGEGQVYCDISTKNGMVRVYEGDTIVRGADGVIRVEENN